MVRRTDYITAEKVSVALLTRAAFGLESGLRYALIAGLNAQLVSEVFSRPHGNVRKDVQGVGLLPDRRNMIRDTT
jgi:hypothetical protein